MSGKSASFASYQNLTHAIAGAAGSVTAMTVFYPLDTVRMRLQVDDELKAKDVRTLIAELIEREGISTLYRGIVPVLQSLCLSNFVYFYSYHGLRNFLYSHPKNRNVTGDLLIGAIAGVINVVTTTPFWVVNTKIKLQGTCLDCEDKSPKSHFDGLFDGLVKVARNEGLSSLWSGTIPSLMLVLNPALQFMVYESLKRMWGIDHQNSHSLKIFLSGAIAKILSTCVTYPLQVIQSKLRYRRRAGGCSDQVGLVKYVLAIVRSHGIRGLYKGLEAKLYQCVLTAAFMFLCYEKIFTAVSTALQRGTIVPI